VKYVSKMNSETSKNNSQRFDKFLKGCFWKRFVIIFSIITFIIYLLVILSEIGTGNSISIFYLFVLGPLLLTLILSIIGIYLINHTYRQGDAKKIGGILLIPFILNTLMLPILLWILLIKTGGIYDNSQSKICAEGIAIIFAMIIIYLNLMNPVYNYHKSWKTTLAEYYEYRSEMDHIGIIIAINPKRMFALPGEEIPNFTEKLRNISEPYRIYFCTTCDEVVDVIKCPKVRRLVIFGHGSIDGVAVNQKCRYAEALKDSLPNIQKKDHIHQMHCNCTNHHTSVFSRIIHLKSRLSRKKESDREVGPSLCDLLLRGEKDEGNATDFGYCAEYDRERPWNYISEDEKIRGNWWHHNLLILRGWKNNEGDRTLPMNNKRLDTYIEYLKLIQQNHNLISEMSDDRIT
jgi:hypothetical protein